MRVLITAAHGDIAEAAARTLREVYRDLFLIGLDLEPGAWPGRDYCDVIEQAPRPDAADYGAHLSARADHWGADLIVPFNEHELRALARAQAAGWSDPRLVMLAPEFVEMALDKLASAQWLAEIGAPAPTTLLLSQADPAAAPLFIKPRAGSGSRGLHAAHTPRDVHALQARLDDTYVAQTLLVDDTAEFTCAVFSWNGLVRSAIMRRRLAGGLSKSITVEAHPAITDVLHQISEAAGVNGCFNVQLRLTEAGPVVFEINPRLSSTLRMRHLAGFTDLVAWVEAASGRPCDPGTAQIGARVYRRDREVLVRPDDKDGH